MKHLHLLVVLLVACGSGADESPVQPPDLPGNVIPCDGSVQPVPLGIARDAHHELFAWAEDRSAIQPTSEAEWAAGLDFFADTVVLPDDLPDWLQPAWPPPDASEIDTSQDVADWSRVYRWEPAWSDGGGSSEPGEWWYLGDVRFDEEGRETGVRDEPLLSSQESDWQWTVYGPGGWAWTDIRRVDGRWTVRESVRGAMGDVVAWQGTEQVASEAEALAAPRTAGQLWRQDPWGRTLYVRDLDRPDGFRADIRAKRWFERDGVAYRPLIEAAMQNILGQENEVGLMDGRYELNEGQTLVELGVVGTQEVSTRCVHQTLSAPRQELLSYVVDDQTGEIRDLGVVYRQAGARVGGASDADGDGIVDRGEDQRTSDDGLTTTRFTWSLVNGERVEVPTSVLYRDERGRPLREVDIVDGVEEDKMRWVHPD